MEKMMSILGGYAVFMGGVVLSLWKKVSILDSAKVSNKTCTEKHDYQTKLNIEIIERLAKVETKLDMGFKSIADKIDRNGNYN